MAHAGPSRRQFVRAAAALGMAAGFAPPVLGAARPRVAIIGGGVGGLAVLQALAGSGQDALDITLIEPKTTYTTCFYSNLYYGGFRELQVLQHGYAQVARLPGVRLIHQRATAVDQGSREVRLADGAVVPYDRLVLSPGIALDYDSVPGWSRDAVAAMPHAWQAGPQSLLLKRQLDAVPDGGLIVMIAPPNPYRCPPGPYERVSMMAHALKSSGRGNARIVIIDPKRNFSKQPLFQQGWETYYPGMIEWLPPMIHAGVTRVDPATMTVETGFETYRNAHLVNVIPRQAAGRIALETELTDDDGYCPVDPASMASRRDPAVFVLGDAAVGGDMPKSAFAAGSQATVVADRIRHELLDAPAAEARYRNKCWSLIAEDDSVFVGGTYEPRDGRIAQVDSEISSLEDDDPIRRRNYADSAAWYLALITRLFG